MEASSSTSGRGRSSSFRTTERVKSVVEDQGVYNSTCGYCKATSRSSIAQGLWAYSLTVQDYQDLLDRGWRRSGMFLYKPHMKSTCCPPYTIRLKAESFIATKDQMRVLRRMQRYLDGKVEGPQTVGELHKDKDDIFERVKGLPSDHHLASVSNRNSYNCESSPADLHQVDLKGGLGYSVNKEGEVLGKLKAAIEATLLRCQESGLLPTLSDPPVVLVKRVPQKVKSKLKTIEGDVDFTSNIAYALAALLKQRSDDEVHSDKSLQESQTVALELKAQEIADMLVGKMWDCYDSCDFTARAVKGHLNFVMADRNLSTSTPLLHGSKQCETGSEKKSNAESKKQVLSSEISTPKISLGELEIRTKRSSFNAEEFALYKKYQVKVHNDNPEDVKESSYRKFLVDSPLIYVPSVNDGSTPLCGFGSFHQQYLINGRLVAVGVIDILPHCLSSKYLFWDPDFAFLSLGKYSALQEIKWVQETQKVCSSLQYYYLGFYIHSCPKMRYKAAYYPSELLCPERFRWVPYELAVPFLDKEPYVCLSDIAGISSPDFKREQEAVHVYSKDNRGSAMEIDTDFSHVEGEKRNASLEEVLKKDALRTLNKSTGPLADIHLYLNGACLPFKHLQELGIVSRWHMDTLVHHLHRYLQVVGPSLATRMAYALS